MKSFGTLQLDLESEKKAEFQSNSTKPAFIYRHIVCFEETNVVGNVYYASHVYWQGRCREMFLREHAPSTLAEIMKDLRLVTLYVSCEYFEELFAFNEVEVQMQLESIQQHRIGLQFNYIVETQQGRRLVATGRQGIGCMRVINSQMEPCAPPNELHHALKRFARS